jgi:DNA-binding LytR/AlgR family response regulator
LSETLRVLIVEDEDDAAQTLVEYLQRYGEERKIWVTSTRLATAFDLPRSLDAYDLALLDIQLPGINGMEAAKELRSRDAVTPIIFVTNLAQLAVRGYEVDALDFIIKPVSYHDFALRMDRAMRRIRECTAGRIAVRTREGTHVVTVQTLEYVEVNKHNLLFHLDDQQTLEARGTLRELEESTKGGTLLRISKSVLVNMEHIDRVLGTELVTTSGVHLVISRTRRREVVEAITRYIGGR